VTAGISQNVKESSASYCVWPRPRLTSLQYTLCPKTQAPKHCGDPACPYVAEWCRPIVRQTDDYNWTWNIVISFANATKYRLCSRHTHCHITVALCNSHGCATVSSISILCASQPGIDEDVSGCSQTAVYRIPHSADEACVLLQRPRQLTESSLSPPAERSRIARHHKAPYFCSVIVN